jgi:hypothetical protein
MLNDRPSCPAPWQSPQRTRGCPMESRGHNDDSIDLPTCKLPVDHAEFSECLTEEVIRNSLSHDVHCALRYAVRLFETALVRPSPSIFPGATLRIIGQPNLFAVSRKVKRCRLLSPDVGVSIQHRDYGSSLQPVMTLEPRFGREKDTAKTSNQNAPDGKCCDHEEAPPTNDSPHRSRIVACCGDDPRAGAEHSDGRREPGMAFASASETPGRPRCRGARAGRARAPMDTSGGG